MYILFTNKKKDTYSSNFTQKLVSGIFFRQALKCFQRRTPLSNSQIFSRNASKHKHCLHLQSYPLEHRHHLPYHRAAAWQKRRATQTANSSPLHRPLILISPSTSQIPPLEISAAVKSALFIWGAYLLGVRSDWGRRTQINLLILITHPPHGGILWLGGCSYRSVDSWGVGACVCTYVQVSAELCGGAGRQVVLGWRWACWLLCLSYASSEYKAPAVCLTRLVWRCLK